ncbi:PucR family transcriptional regulator [Fusibacter ferrireducens]|uniref:Helix-turn-helix domain-containing protein n=1 Tax=Fusibacter ferrireducens TaxID=2785058 RepID=A0ABR9ZVS6_9FIRM|nr:helix-turn-helix domain-containing protein [Fusibacter ferrireducens]MBF4694446.1 helix-turn-helix domain-containing protein [Fusibacter ferrireducens]
MKSDELILTLSPFIKGTLLRTSNIKIENGISLLLPNAYIRQDGVYICKMQTFQSILNSKNSLQNVTFFVVDCVHELPKLDDAQDTCSYIFLTCSLDELSTVFSKIFEQKKRLIDHGNYEKMKILWQQLIQTPRHKDELRTIINEFYYSFRRFVACIVLIMKQDHPKLSENDLYLLFEELNDLFPETNIFPFKNQIVILYSQDNRPDSDLAFSYDKFSLILEKYHMDAGISNACRYPLLYPTLYHTSLSSLYLGRKLSSYHISDNIYNFENYSTFYIIDLSVKEFIRIHGHSDIIYLVSPDIIQLHRYDLDHNTDLLTTLFQYLLNGCNITVTSKILYMHRNTVFNKLKKIKNIISDPLDDGQIQFKLLMSCFVVTYYKEYLEQNL